MKKAMLIIDFQKDYFKGGKFPLWNTEKTLKNTLDAIKKAKSIDMPVILVQDAGTNTSLFINEGSKGAGIHPEILKVCAKSEIVVKHYADAFYNTNLDQILSTLGIEEILVCGMMTQNCVTHTAISKYAEKYKVKVLKDCCTTVNKSIHEMALEALSTSVEVENHEYAVNEYNNEELLICGMMTQNCVTHTAISKNAEKYKVKVIKDCCTTVNEPIHKIALNALSTRVDLVDYEEAI